MQQCGSRGTRAFRGAGDGTGDKAGSPRSPAIIRKRPTSTARASSTSNEAISTQLLPAPAIRTVGGAPPSDGVADSDLDDLINSVMASPAQSKEATVMNIMATKSDAELSIEGVEMDSEAAMTGEVPGETSGQRSQPKRAFEEGVEESKGIGSVESKASTPKDTLTKGGDGTERSLSHKERFKRNLTTAESGVHEDEYEDDFEVHTTRLPMGQIGKAKTFDGKSNTFMDGGKAAESTPVKAAEESTPQTPGTSPGRSTSLTAKRGTMMGGLTRHFSMKGASLGVAAFSKDHVTGSSGGLGDIMRATSEGVGMLGKGLTKSLSQWTRNDSDDKNQQALTTANFTRAPMTKIEDGLMAYGIGPFCERADVFYIPNRQGPMIRIGRYLGFSYMNINIKFQDHSVMYNAAEVQYKKASKTFRVKCTDENGILVAWREEHGNRLPVSAVCHPGEEMDVYQCSAIRFGLHSWVSFMPFKPNLLQISGHYRKGGPFSCLVHAPVTTLGGTKECSVYFPIPGIDPMHCRILKTESGFVIIDNQTKTGTYINGIRILAPTGAILFPGARITFGAQAPDAYLDVLVDPKIDGESRTDWQVDLGKEWDEWAAHHGSAF